jgi:hypothetical protein
MLKYLRTAQDTVIEGLNLLILSPYKLGLLKQIKFMIVNKMYNSLTLLHIILCLLTY